VADDESLLDEPKSMITKPALDDEFSMELDGEIIDVTEDAPNPRTIGKLDDDLCEEEIEEEITEEPKFIMVKPLSELELEEENACNTKPSAELRLEGLELMSDDDDDREDANCNMKSSIELELKLDLELESDDDVEDV
jgi:hypothetical protein